LVGCGDDGCVTVAVYRIIELGITLIVSPFVQAIDSNTERVARK